MDKLENVHVMNNNIPGAYACFPYILAHPKTVCIINSLPCSFEWVTRNHFCFWFLIFSRIFCDTYRYKCFWYSVISHTNSWTWFVLSISSKPYCGKQCWYTSTSFVHNAHIVVPVSQPASHLYTRANNNLILWQEFSAKCMMSTKGSRFRYCFYHRFALHTGCTRHFTFSDWFLSFAVTTIFTDNFNEMWFHCWTHKQTNFNVKCHFMCIPHARAHLKSSKLPNTH